MRLLPRPRSDKARKDDADFWKYHDANPWVFDALAGLALKDIRAGMTSFGIDGYCIIVRWKMREATMSTDGFRLNDKFASRYARLLIHVHPELDGFFELREGKLVRGFDPSRGGQIGRQWHRSLRARRQLSRT